MAGHSINVTSSLRCPHNGMVRILSTNAQTRANGAFMASTTDTFIIVGCPFHIGTTPSPCVTVRWLVPDSRVRINGSQTLSRSSAGICLNSAKFPQGPVVVVSSQTRVQSL
jgi:hypothetical protein